MEYKIVFVDNKTNYIATDRKNKELLISNDIEVSRTDDGKIQATFQNPQKKEPSFMDFVHDIFGQRKTDDNSDCSVIIDDPSVFHYCVRKDGEYQLFGGGVTFNGTEHDDKLTMYECQNSTVNLHGGNDTVKIANANGFLADFQNNIVNTGNGNDSVTISGNFNQFTNNKFFLGKGNDSFNAEINPEHDENITNSSSYDNMEPLYMKNVSGSEVRATDGEKGLFEKDLFHSKSYSANNLLLSDFESKNVTLKATPDRPVIIPEKQKTMKTETQNTAKVQTKQEKVTKSKETLTKEDIAKKMRLGELIYYTTGKPDVLENAYKQTEEWLVK